LRFPGKEVLMRRVSSWWLVVAAGSLIASLDGSNAYGTDHRTSIFRELTSEGRGAHAATAPAEPTLAEPTPADQHPPSRVDTAPTMSPRVATRVHMPAVSPMQMPVGFHGVNSARTAFNPLPRRAALQPGPRRPMQRQAKPFESVESNPTISPYLDLDRDEDDTQSAPTYFMYVRPRLEQIEKNRVQQREIQQLRGQLQNAAYNAGAPTQYEANRSPARFMDTAQFYGGAR
jgi:hypothetical protein